jgi:hypothetical protein
VLDALPSGASRHIHRTCVHGSALHGSEKRGRGVARHRSADTSTPPASHLTPRCLRPPPHSALRQRNVTKVLVSYTTSNTLDVTSHTLRAGAHLHLLQSSVAHTAITAAEDEDDAVLWAVLLLLTLIDGVVDAVLLVDSLLLTLVDGVVDAVLLIDSLLLTLVDGVVDAVLLIDSLLLTVIDGVVDAVLLVDSLLLTVVDGVIDTVLLLLSEADGVGDGAVQGAAPPGLYIPAPQAVPAADVCHTSTRTHTQTRIDTAAYAASTQKAIVCCCLPRRVHSQIRDRSRSPPQRCKARSWRDLPPHIALSNTHAYTHTHRLRLGATSHCLSSGHQTLWTWRASGRRASRPAAVAGVAVALRARRRHGGRTVVPRWAARAQCGAARAEGARVARRALRVRCTSRAPEASDRRARNAAAGAADTVPPCQVQSTYNGGMMNKQETAERGRNTVQRGWGSECRNMVAYVPGQHGRPCAVVDPTGHAHPGAALHGWHTALPGSEANCPAGHG